MAATDDFTTLTEQAWQAPYFHAAAVSPDDSNDLSHVTRALMIGVAGDLKVTTAGGETVTLSVPAGELRIRAVRVFSTGTTASNITAMW